MNKIISHLAVFLSLLCLTSTITCAQPPKRKVEPARLIPYKTVGAKKLQLHVFEPADHKPTDRRAAIVFFFGGGWTSGNPSQFYHQSRTLADLGMVAFSAEYRVHSRDKTTPLECVKDAKSAIRWVRAHAKELGIDPDRIVASGGSAGGHIAACTALVETHDEADEDLKISSKPNALILFNPALDISKETGFSSKILAPELQTPLSPVHQIRKGLPPTIIFHGTADKIVPFEQAERFNRLMKASNNQCQLVPAQGKDHGYFNSSLTRPDQTDTDFNLTMKHSEEFLKQHHFINEKK